MADREINRLERENDSLRERVEELESAPCEMCGQDPRIAAIGKRLGFRPDVGALEIRRLEDRLEKAEAERDRTLKAARIYRAASLQEHSSHWDSKGTRGASCPECERSRKLRAEADSILAAAEGEGDDA